MPCYHPLRGWKSRTLNPSGKRSIVFKKDQGYSDLEVTLPCGQCHGCRLERSRQWAIRCVHEASLHEDNCFLTLTLDDEHLGNGSLVKSDLQKFLKRVRKKYSPKTIRFYACGEYGELYRRPHYHLILFNHDFKDKVLWSTRDQINLYTSAELSQLWTYGHSTIGEVTFESAAYVARYIMKKIKVSDETPDHLLDHYLSTDIYTGECFELTPEYTTMSVKPGIASDWLSKYKHDTYKDDSIIIRGKKLQPPQFYDRKFEIEYPTDFKKIKNQRKSQLSKHLDNCTTARLRVRESVNLKKVAQLIRPLESN